MRFKADELASGNWPQAGFTDARGQRWVLARPLNADTLMDRLRDAWAVFVGRADALFWESPR